MAESQKLPRVGLIANPHKEGAHGLLKKLIAAFAERKAPVLLDERSSQIAGTEPSGLSVEEVGAGSDVIVVLGGDGTLLWLANELGAHVKPLAAVNVGTLGFLTCATVEDYEAVVEAVLGGEYEVSHRTLLEATLRLETGEEQRIRALNEITLSRGVASCMVHLVTYIDGQFLNHYTGDGLIVSTPTGSTAYSLSAGGPILEPESGVFVITPICAHALANRAIVVDDEREIELRIPLQRDGLLMAADGRPVAEISGEAAVRIRKAPFQVPLVRMRGSSFYQVLQQKLGWFGSAVMNSNGVR